MKTIDFNGRWPINLPDHRADRPINDWWEAQRLAAMYSRVRATGNRLYYEGINNGVPPDAIFPRPRVLDVGAEEGDFPTLMTLWGAEVFCVEPNPKAWPWIKQTFEMNGVEPAGTFVGLLGSPDQANVASSTRWSWPPEADEPDPTPEHGFHHLAEHLEVDCCMTMNDLVDSTGFVPDIVTMDVEGGEMHVLMGAAEVLIEHRPELFISIHPQFLQDLYEQTIDDIHGYMGALDYRAQYICADHEEHWHFVHHSQPWPWAD